MRHLPLLALAAMLAACSSHHQPDNAANAANVAIEPDNTVFAATAEPDEAPGAAPQPVRPKTFGDWAVGCDTIGDCTMESLGAKAGVAFPPVDLAIARDAGTDGGVQVLLQPHDSHAAPDALTVDGRRFAGFARQRDGSIALTGDAARALAVAIASGHDLRVLGDAGATSSVSTDGAAAALRYIDAQQGRAGTASALVARGSAAGGPIDREHARPSVVAVAPIGAPTRPSQALLGRMAKQAACDAAPRSKPELHQIGGDTTLVLVPCQTGAYNQITAAFLLHNGEAAPADADAPVGLAATGAAHDRIPHFVNARFAGGVLTSEALGRGLGDCGIRQRFVWDGRRFRLVGQAEMPVCRGNPNFIPTYRADIAFR